MCPYSKFAGVLYKLYNNGMRIFDYVQDYVRDRPVNILLRMQYFLDKFIQVLAILEMPYRYRIPFARYIKNRHYMRILRYALLRLNKLAMRYPESYDRG